MTTAAASTAALCGGWIHAAPDEPSVPAKNASTLPTITVGKTGRVLPRIGLGGYPICRIDEEQANAVLRHAFDRGVRYIDTAPSYGGGRSESRIGKALQAYDRSEFCIATKTLERHGSGARRELEQSLKRLELDYVDVMQVHEVHDDYETLFRPDGVIAALEKARDEKLIGHIGITGHRNPSYLIESIKRYPFATALVPVNPLDTKHLSFTRDFLPVAKERTVAVIAMKVFAGGSLLADDRFTAGELLRYALSQEHVSIVVPGCAAVDHIDEAIAAGVEFEPINAEEAAALEERVGEHRGRSSEWYKENT
jgi:aryl-alcohol dehydrogenase-like predicted oxidoreductase